MKFDLRNGIDKLASRLADSGKDHMSCGGDCSACPEKGSCSVYAAPMVRAAAKIPPEPQRMSAEEIGRALTLAEPFAAWLEAVKAHALDTLLTGGDIPGWKAVEGRSNRRFTDSEAALLALEAGGVPHDTLYERKPLSPAQIEKRIGTEVFRQLAGGFVEKPAGKPVLAPDGDARKACCISIRG